MIRTLGALSAEHAEDALLTLGGHLPHGTEIGRPLVAAQDDDGVQLVTDLCCWWITTDEAVRLLPVSGDRVEHTRWRHGVEISRTVHSSG